MRLQRHLFMAAFVLSTTMIPCLAQATRSPEISEQDLAPYKEVGSGSIEGVLTAGWRDHNHNHFRSTPGNVKVSFVPVTPYTQRYFTDYRNMLLNRSLDFHGGGAFSGKLRATLPLAYLDQRVYALARSTITQADGSYHLENIAPGSYFFIAEWSMDTVWGAGLLLVFEIPREPVVVNNNQTTHVDIGHLENPDPDCRACFNDSCGEFVQDQWFPKENSLVINKEQLEEDR